MPNPAPVQADSGYVTDRSFEAAAADLIAAHGPRAQQYMIDALVLAVKAGDEAEITRLDGILKALERMVQDAKARR